MASIASRFRGAAAGMALGDRHAHAVRRFPGDPDDKIDASSQFRQVGFGKWNEDMKIGQPMGWRRSLEWVEYLEKKSPIYGRILSIMAGYVVGAEPVRVRFAESAFADVYEEFVSDGQNTLFSRPRRHFLRWWAYGEAPYRISIGPYGKVFFSHVHPSKCMDVIFKDDDEDRPELIFMGRPVVGERDRESILPSPGTIYADTASSQDFRYWWPVARVRRFDEGIPAIANKPYPYRYRRNDFDVSVWDVPGTRLKQQPLQDGLALYARTNNTTTMRGMPHYMSGFHLFDQLEQFFADAILRVKLFWSLVWHVVYKGEGESELIARLKKRKLFLPGEVIVSNESVEIKPQNPDLKMQDLRSLVDAVKTNLAVCGGVPMMMLSEEDSTRAHAFTQESVTATATMQPARREYIDEIASPAIRHIVDSRVYHDSRRFPPTMSRHFDVELPPMTREDLTEKAGTWAQLSSGVAMGAETLGPELGGRILEKAAVTLGWITDQELEQYRRMRGMGADEPLQGPPEIVRAHTQVYRSLDALRRVAGVPKTVLLDLARETGVPGNGHR